MKWRESIGGEQQQEHEDDDDDEATSDAVNKLRSPSSDSYDLPFGMSFIRHWTFFKFVPFCPTFLVDITHSQATEDLENGRVVGEVTELSPVNNES